MTLNGHYARPKFQNTHNTLSAAKMYRWLHSLELFYLIIVASRDLTAFLYSDNPIILPGRSWPYRSDVNETGTLETETETETIKNRSRDVSRPRLVSRL